MQHLFNRIAPFLILGVAIVAISFGLILLAYLFVFGAIIGLVLYSAAWIRNKFFTPKKPVKPEKPQTGRIIDSDDFKEL